MKPVDVNSSTYVKFGKENNEKDPNFDQKGISYETYVIENLGTFDQKEFQ